MFLVFYRKYLIHNVIFSEEFNVNDARNYSDLFDFFIDFGSFYKKHFLHDFQTQEDFGFNKNLISFNGISFHQMFEDYQKQNIDEENRFMFDFLPYFNN